MREAEASRVTPSILPTTYSTSFHSNRISDRVDSIEKAQLGAMLDSGDPTTGTTRVTLKQSSRELLLNELYSAGNW
jgi:hypothetical protein